METRKWRHGFTVIELIVVVIVVLLLIGILLPLLERPHPHGSRQIKDSTQVRGIHQGMVLWAQNNKDVYPLPSLVDDKDETVADQGAAKDTTANIISIMIYNGFFSPELCVSPAESNQSIKVIGNYSYSSPAAAVNPAKALWDPAFATDFTGGKTGYFSHAHTPPADERLKKTWDNTFQATEAVIGNRGPEITAMTTGKGRTFTTAIPSSNTYLIHGGRTTWEGNIAYNDNHIAFETRIDPESTPYTDAAGKAWFDCLFYDEPDDPKSTNNFLGNFVKAGSTGAEFKAIWD
jgi:prepilin-type N-terminal cleavage/methylation domain-containing protein